MADTGWLSPTTCENWDTEAPGNWPWDDQSDTAISLGSGNTDVVNAGADSKTAKPSGDSRSQTRYLWVYGYDTSGIPTGATIDGVEVRIDVDNVSSAPAAMYFDEVRLSVDESIVGDNKGSTSTVITAGDNTFGGASDDWNASLAAGDNMEVAIAVHGQVFFGGHALDIDHVELKVYYTEASSNNIKAALYHARHHNRAA